MGGQILNWQAGEQPRVLLVIPEDEPAGMYQEWLAGVGRVESARTIDDAVTTLDERVFVLVLDTGFQEKPHSALTETVQALLPWCQIVSLSQGETPNGLDADHHLQKPVERESFREAVTRGLAAGTLDAALHDFYRLNARLVEHSNVRTTMGSSWEPEIDRIRKALAAVKTRLPALKADVSLDHFAIVARASRIGRQYDVENTSHSLGRTTGSKYRPDYCPSCRVDWTGSRLTPGAYVPIAAFVWQCRSCRRIYQARKTKFRRGQ